ncbi:MULTISPECIES: hypothetical protein [Dickeya]|uniref:hypothetical protein n=1 Tax=Dickeya TaxID=204037 RepID=UPI0005595ABF|nr:MULTISPECIES: hypothetical protein [Dickeya]
MTNNINGLNKGDAAVDGAWKIQVNKRNEEFNEILSIVANEQQKNTMSPVSLVNAKTGNNVFNSFVSNFLESNPDTPSGKDVSDNLSKEEKFILNEANSLLRNRIIFNKYISQLQNSETNTGSVIFVKI